MARPPETGETGALAPTTPNTTDGSGGPIVPPFRPTDKIGNRYQLEGLLGRGGMGTVYRARDEALGGQPVALKLVAGDVSNSPVELKRLRDEVVLAQKVTHPAVCRTYDLEEIDGLWMIKMEVVDGESLAHRMRGATIPIDEVLRIAREILSGLAAAHRQGVIHRDLKPQNVMIERDTGRIVLMDFGIARDASARTSRSSIEPHRPSAALMAGHGSRPSMEMVDIVGTPDYMAPEQARGDAVDARTDLYALGCVVYEMLTGAVPKRAAAGAAMPDPRLLRPETPRWLSKLIRSLLDPDPDRRPASVRAVLAVATNRRRFVRRIGIAVVAVAIVIGAASWYVARPRNATPWQPVLVEVLPRVDENLADLAISPDGKQLAFDSDRDQRNGTFRTYVGPLGSTEARALTPAGETMTLSEWADATNVYAANDLTGISYLVPVAGGAPTRIGDRGVPTPCGDALMIRTHELGDITHLELQTRGQPNRVLLELHPPEILVGTVHCSHDGKRAVYAIAGEDNVLAPRADLWELSIANGTRRQLTNDKRRNYNGSFTPDGTIVFSSARGGSVNVWELPADGGEPTQLTFDAGEDVEPIVTPDGKQLVYALDNTTSVIRSYGEAPGRISSARDLYSSLTAAPDVGELLVVTPAPDAITAIALADGSRRSIAIAAHGKPPDQVTITPDGASIIYTAGREVYAMPRAGGAARLVATLDGDLEIIRAGPDHAIHAMLEAPERQEAWRIPLDGSAPAREGGANAALVLPAANGWQLVVESGQPFLPHPAHLIPPDARPGDPKIRTFGVAAAPAWSIDGRVLAYFDGAKVHRLDVKTGVDRIIASPSDTEPSLAVAPDGTVYMAALEGFVRRYIMTNFSERPR